MDRKLSEAVTEWGGDNQFVLEKLATGEWVASHVEAYIEGLKCATLALCPNARRQLDLSERLKELCKGKQVESNLHETQRWKDARKKVLQREREWREAHGQPVHTPPEPPRAEASKKRRITVVRVDPP